MAYALIAMRFVLANNYDALSILSDIDGITAVDELGRTTTSAQIRSVTPILPHTNQPTLINPTNH